MFRCLGKAIHIVYAQEPSQSDRIFFPNLQYVCAFKEVARLEDYRPLLGRFKSVPYRHQQTARYR